MTLSSTTKPPNSKIWKTDLFLSLTGDDRYFAATVKSNVRQLEGGRGLRIGIVPESSQRGHRPGVSYSEKYGLRIATLPDPNGFTSLFNDAYKAVAWAVCTLGQAAQAGLLHQAEC